MSEDDDGSDVARMTEPLPIDCVFLEGITIEIRAEVVRLVGWVDLETVEFDRPERRIVARAVMPLSLARGLAREIRKALSRGGH